jgi:putative phosphoribosyl transferase
MNFLDETITVPLNDSIQLEGQLFLPEDCKGVILFAHESGSSRYSIRNNFVAEHLHEKNLGTFLFDLLTPEEDLVYSNRFDIELLSRRLSQVAGWLLSQKETRHLPLGYYGANTGSASALFSAASMGNQIKGIVSRSGRPDLAKRVLHNIKSPVLFIVGSMDHQLIRINHDAYRIIRSDKEISVIPGATHLFGEPGKLGTVAELTSEWFLKKFLKFN